MKDKINFAKTRIDAIIPTKRTEDAGYDIYACWSDLKKEDRVLKPFQTKLIPTGIACALPEKYYFQIEERGSTGSKGIKRSAGVVDSGYRGEIFVALTNVNEIPVVFGQKEDYKIDNAIYYPENKAIAQLILHNVIDVDVEIIDYEELKQIPSIRQTNILGSSGK